MPQIKEYDSKQEKHRQTKYLSIIPPGKKKCGISTELKDDLLGFKLIKDKMQNVFYLIAENFGFIKYTLNKLD